jgi:subtilisin family serine protease
MDKMRRLLLDRALPMGILCALLRASGVQAEVLEDAVMTGDFPHLSQTLLSKGRFPVRVESPEAARALGAVPITDTWAVLTGGRDSVRRAMAEGYTPLFGPGQRTLLEEAGRHNFLQEARVDYGLDGSSVFVGIVDTGASLAHPAFRLPGGATRVKWLLTFDRAPLGLHPELEEQYGCSNGSCAVLAAADIDGWLGSPGSAELPLDTIGHGTHVASTAAGRDGKYPGVAPGADLLVVQSGDGGNALADGDILLGARFIMDRAAEAGRPCVLNLSLGSNFGSHDGASPLEQGLAELAAGPGRAIVVASGNEGSVYSIKGSALPEPLGIHTEAAVVPGGETHVTFLPAYQGDAVATIFAWVAFQPGDHVEIAFESQSGRTRFVGPGDAALIESREIGDSNSYEVGILNGRGLEAFGDVPEGHAVFIWAGNVPGKKPHELIFRGKGTVELWVESVATGDEGSLAGVVLVPRARTSGTVTIPASHPDLITVGASVNRATWPDYSGATIASQVNVSGLADFSSAGPNHLGHVKPDLLAPGQNLIAAMAAEADPREGEGASQFQDPGLCPEAGTQCMVVDDEHAISSGTSMAAPQVTGAIALLLQRDPTLTMTDLRALLRGGAQPVLDEGYPSNWYGSGQLDIRGSLIALDRRDDGALYPPSARKTRLALANTFLSPSSKRSMRALLLLRDEQGEPAGGFTSDELRVDVNIGKARILSLDAGVAELELSAPDASGGQQMMLRVFYGDEDLVEASIPIGVDPTAAIVGYEVSGGCSVSGSRTSKLTGLGLSAAAFLLWALHRRRGAPHSRLARHRLQ